ncbi:MULTISPECIES: hypothetical protein [Agrobacterium]|uniref:hypothetical protein n=1 Tax=Agrobacterium TaxID=357 RepID=UPI0015729F46|nr:MULTISPECIES: hypothetical protein [Agrobacterium]
MTTHNASGGPSIACNANRTSPACVAAITDTLKAVEYLRDPANPMDPSSMVAGGYADLEMRLVNGAFGGLSNQDLAAVVYAERLRTIELLTRYPDSVQAALKGFVNQSIVNAAIAVLTFGIAEKIGATGPKGNAGQTSGEATNNQNGTTSGTSAASNANAQAALKAKLSGLQKAQQSAVVTKTRLMVEFVTIRRKFKRELTAPRAVHRLSRSTIPPQAQQGSGWKATIIQGKSFEFIPRALMGDR